MVKCGKYGDRHEILVSVLLADDGFISSPDFLSELISDCDESRGSIRVC